METPETTFLELAELAPIDRYKLLIGAVVPRPIGWIGSVDLEGRRNLAPYSFFNVVAATPPTVFFAPGHRRGRPKDTLANVMATGEFTVNVVDEALAEAMNLTSGEYGPEVDEAALAGLEMRPGRLVAAPYVVASPAVLECKVVELVELGDPPTSTVVFGRILGARIRSELLAEGRVDPFGLRAVGRMAGAGYTRTVDGYFEMERPSV
ncbi:MAG TPA: flavin reductase family protein [Actinobacteria bacterium]|nr:flavin reductase family protein [Actinomycetota bacterium]